MLEFRNDGSGPKFYENGKEVPAPRGGGLGVQDNPMEELLRRMKERRGSGSLRT